MESQEKEFRLPRKFAENWVKALRSGEYDQARGVLYIRGDGITHDGYCCLGVAGDLCGVQKSYLTLEKTLQSLPIPLLRDLHVPKELIDISKGSLAITLMRMNDGYSVEGYDDAEAVEKHSFAEIADWIEQNVEFYNEEITT